MKFRSVCFFAVLAVPALAFAQKEAASQASVFAKDRPRDASDAFFEKGEIPRIAIELADDQAAMLKNDARTYVQATLKENDKTIYKDVALKLKGAAGSFRELDDKPAFTINVDKFDEKLRFHDLKKFHLNNSVQDDTYLDEYLCSDLMRAAGVPTPRVTHARVWLNGRDLGLYVLKESFDRQLLARFFQKPTGNLYDGGFCQEVDAGLEKDTGKGVDDKSDLAAIAEACREQDPSTRWQKIEQRLDVDAFLTFVAMELVIGHWDGYAQNTNNYRLYVEPTTNRAYFLAHGMDQVFQDPEFSVLDYPNALVADSVMRNPEWRARYRKTLSDLVLTLHLKERATQKARAVQKRLEPILKAMDPQFASEHEQRVKELISRIEDRDKNLRDQIRRPEPKTLSFDAKAQAHITGFAAHGEAGDPKIEQAVFKGRRVYEIVCGKEPCVASWRKKVMLPKGKYTFEAIAAIEGVEALPDDPASGMGIHVSGAEGPPRQVGGKPWQPTKVEFEVLEETRLVELVVELRAKKGAARFDLTGMRVVKRG